MNLSDFAATMDATWPPMPCNAQALGLCAKGRVAAKGSVRLPLWAIGNLTI